VNDAALGKEVDSALRRLRALLPSRIGPRATAEIIKGLSRAREAGTPLLAQLQAATSTLDAFADRDPITAPWPSAMCRAIATVAPKKLAHFSFLGRRQRVLPDVLVRGVADHAQLLTPSFGDVDDPTFSLGVAWHNVLTYHCALVGGECHNRNSARPVVDLWQACADAGLADDDVPVCLVRGHGIVIARGYEPPREDRPFVARELIAHLWGQGRTSLGVVGDGCFDGVRWLLEEARGPFPLDTAHLPLWLALASLPCDPRADIVDEDDVISGLAAVEDQLEQERLVGTSVHARLGVPPDPAPALTSLRLRVGTTRLRLKPGLLAIDD